MITLIVHGRERTFTKAELTAIVEEHLNNKASNLACNNKFATTPKEGMWFVVEPAKINQKLFEEKREDPEQEKARQKILAAFKEMEADEKYSERFRTTFPYRSWEKNKGKELKELWAMAKLYGDDVANEAEQALEWAQRISNGESWEKVCNERDMALSYRAVGCKYPGLFKLVGGSTEANSNVSATHVLEDPVTSFDKVGCTVPLIISRTFPE